MGIFSIFYLLTTFATTFLLIILLKYLWYFFFLTYFVAAQITQWDLIFYGTDEPPQKNDPPRVLGKMKNVNDLEHNSLDSSQWGFITQDVSIFIQIIFQSICLNIIILLHRLTLVVTPMSNAQLTTI